MALGAGFAAEPPLSPPCPPGVVWQLPGDDRTAGPQLRALPAEAGQRHQQLQRQPHLGQRAAHLAGLVSGLPPGFGCCSRAPSSNLLLGALTPNGGSPTGSGHQGGPSSPPHVPIKVKHWPGRAAASLGLGAPAVPWPSLDLSFPSRKMGFSGKVRWQFLLSRMRISGTKWGQLWADIRGTPHCRPKPSQTHWPRGHLSFNSWRRGPPG